MRNMHREMEKKGRKKRREGEREEGLFRIKEETRDKANYEGVGYFSKEFETDS